MHVIVYVSEEINKHGFPTFFDMKEESNTNNVDPNNADYFSQVKQATFCPSKWRDCYNYDNISGDECLDGWFDP